MPEIEYVDEETLAEIKQSHARQLATLRQRLTRSEERAQKVEGLEAEIARLRKKNRDLGQRLDSLSKERDEIAREKRALEVQDRDVDIRAAEVVRERVRDAERRAGEADARVHLLEAQNRSLSRQVDELRELEHLARQTIETSEAFRRKLGQPRRRP